MLIKNIPDGRYDIIGDIHGEFTVFLSLLQHLGYDRDGRHPEGRRLIFLGDVVDRGLQSVTMLTWIMHAVQAGYAECVIGNHELNIIQNDDKHGAGWWWDHLYHDEIAVYGHVERVADNDRHTFITFLRTLPLVLIAPTFRVVHAMWDNDAVQELTGQYHDAFERYHQRIQERYTDLYDHYVQEQRALKKMIEDEKASPPALPMSQRYNLTYQNEHPFRLLTSGREEIAMTPFYASGKWRVTSRAPWWNDYYDITPVFIGHYWREWTPQSPHEVFGHLQYHEWCGPQKNVFCLDYSVGKKYRQRLGYNTDAHLTALRYPEYMLLRHDGQSTVLEQPSHSVC